MVSKETFYTIALSMVPGIGHIRAAQLIEHCGSAKKLFEDFPKLIKKFGSKKEAYHLEEIMELAHAELAFMQKHEVHALNFQEEAYPQRLKECADKPIVLYTKGKMDLNQKTVISIVGSRNATLKGREICRRLIEELAIHQPLIVSGLAYGIDVTAHQAALDCGLQTVGVLGSGLKIIYPNKHHRIAKQMQLNGGIISDYPADTKLLPSQFAERNRIVAGLADVTIVIESSVKGGSMITAGLALGYNREVFAIPGRVEDELSSGCNFLIKQNKAALIENAKDVAFLLGLDQKKKNSSPKQIELFTELNEEEGRIVNELKKVEQLHIDELSLRSDLLTHKVSVILLELEFKGIIRSLPGKRYQLA